MSRTDEFANAPSELLSLDIALYNLGDAESAFFKQQTGIQDDAELKAHIVNIQAKAFAIHPYPCIRQLAWTQLKISRLFPYNDLLKLGAERDGAIFLEMGCCFGNDLRKAIADGYPQQNVVATDLHQAFWDLGHELFKTTPETFSVPFVAGDAFDAACLEITPPFTKTSPPTTSRPILTNLTSLNPLHGHVSAIHASSFFHLFDEEGQLHLARAMAGLLSPEPGSMIFGRHAGLPEKGLRPSSITGKFVFCHGVDSWRELWDGEIFLKGTVTVENQLEEADRSDVKRAYEMPEGTKFWWLTWKVTRL
ncbi:hypothetical protein OF83DRAFT_1167837 [Amylostereum chailletii]|nr:hypothetical protein OF83DRAFT_1167837 [Amylostereum chailletii]